MTVAPPDPAIAFSARALGSALRLHVRLADGSSSAGVAAAEAAWAEVRDEFDAVDVALSRFRTDSELTMLNRRAGDGSVAVVSRRLRTALAAVHRAGRLTDGRFDARVLGALERIGEHGAPLEGGDEAPGRTVPGGEMSDGTEVGAAPRRRAEPLSRVRVPDAPLDMGGIGKGLALRWAAARAIAVLPPGAGLLLEAGGDVVHAGAPPADGWMVGIEDPVAPTGPDGEPLVVVAVRDGAVATSSIRVRNWIGPDGRPVHHLLDPSTGEPARTGLIAVTVAGADPAWSEVWSKALFLAGRDGIADEARSGGMAAWWVDDRGRLGMTPDARLRCAWVAEERLG
ncbi:MAG: FAD:protein FMN transferase [Chloroflexota bacterium]